MDRRLNRYSPEIAVFESKTKELYEWRRTLKKDSLVDCRDKTSWVKSTILDTRTEMLSADRKFEAGFIGFRVYQEEVSTKKDEGGYYEGYSNKFDEWISLFSPRIQPYNSKSSKGAFLMDTEDIDEDFDEHIPTPAGFDRVWAVPRIRKCTSSLMIEIINTLGQLKGYDLILEYLEQAKPEDLPMSNKILL